MLNAEATKVLKGELAAVNAQRDALLIVLGLSMAAETQPAAPPAAKVKRAVKAAAAASTGKRGPDSELTKARKRISSAKRFGKEPAQADVDLVGAVEATPAAAE